jgi:hypothetical protein
MSKHAATRSGRDRRSGWVPFLCVLAAIAALSASAISWVIAPNWGRHDAIAAPRTVGRVPPSQQPPAQQPVTVHDSPVAQARLTPDRIAIPALHVTAPIIKVGTLPGGALQVPRNPKIAGWWAGGASPGAPTGTAVIAGHINYSGVTGAFAHIGKLNPGDTVYVYGTREGKSTRLAFKVTGVRTYLKHGLPYKKIFNQDVSGRLVLVTCGGPFDARTGNYLDNIVTYAVPA